MGVLFVLVGLAALFGGAYILDAMKNVGALGGLFGGILGGLIAYLGILTLIASLFPFLIGYFLWKRNKLVYYIVLISAFLSLLTVLAGNLVALLALIPIYILWIDKGTRALFA